MSDISARLSGDNSEFRAMLNESAASAEKFAGNIAGKVAGKLTGLRDVSTALAAALGINIASIGENIARIVTGMSKETEEALKRVVDATQRAADINIATMRAAKTEQQRYQDDLKMVQRLLGEQKSLQDLITKAKAGEVDAMLGLVHNQKELGMEMEREAQIAEIGVKLAEAGKNIKDYELKQAGEKNKTAKAAQDDEQKHFSKIVEMTAKQIEAERSRLTLGELMAALRADEAGWLAVLADATANREVHQNAQLEVEKTRAKMREVELDDEKVGLKNAAALEESLNKTIEIEREKLPLVTQRDQLLQNEKTLMEQIGIGLELGFDVTRQLKELDQVRGELRKVETEQQKEHIELAKLLLIPAEKLTEGDKIRLQLLQGQVTPQQLQAETTQLMAGLVAGVLTPAEKERLAVLLGQAEVLDKQLETAKAITVTVSRTGKSADQQSDESLEGVRDRLKRDVTRLQQEQFGQPGGVGSPFGFKSPELVMLESELFNVQKELNQRREVQGYASRFGEDAARRQFGDTLTERSLRDWTDQATRTTTALEDIQKRLQIVIPKV